MKLPKTSNLSVRKARNGLGVFTRRQFNSGTIKIRVSKRTDMRHRIFGWIKASLQDMKPKVELKQNKWMRLTENQRPPANL
ncbi:MAG: hypothetical protein AAB572_01385 [Patescibacteria group bacterium]